MQGDSELSLYNPESPPGIATSDHSLQSQYGIQTYTTPEWCFSDLGREKLDRRTAQRITREERDSRSYDEYPHGRP